MDVPQDHDAELLSRGGPPAVLIRDKAIILQRFTEELRRRIPAARREPSSILINTLPAFITRLARALVPDDELQFASEFSNFALAHGNERAKLTGYSLSELIHEYQVLREILMDLFRDESHLSRSDWDIVHRSIDEAMAESASAFMRVHQQFRDMFTAALSHDFRSPLSNAINYLDLIRRNAEPEQHSHFAARALYNLRMIGGMISELLDATRANSGMEIPLHVEQCEATTLVREAVGDLTLRAGDRFVVEAKSTVSGHWDSDRLKQALTNLLENAVKYGKDGTPVTCRVSSENGRLFISIHNEGDPIPPELIPVLFEPFRRAPSAEQSRKSGWGLGLVMVQAIAEAHGGSVGVESTETEGTVFTLDVLCDARQKKAD